MDRGNPALRVVDEGGDPPVDTASAPALDDLFEAYAPYVATIGRRILGRSHEVEDLVQDVFVAALGGIDRKRSPAEIKGWLATVTVRTAQRRLRRRRLRGFVGLDRDAGDCTDVAGPGATPEHRAQLALIYRVLDELPVPERVAWTLRHAEGESLQRVAQLCGCSLATAKRRIAAAHVKIRRVVADG